MWDLLRISATVEASNFKFSTELGFGTSLPKNNDLDQNWRGFGLGEHPKKFGTPTYFCNRSSQQLQIWYTNWVWDQLTKKRRLVPKLAGVVARGASKKNWDPLYIFATVEASNFKFGTQIGFGTSLPKNDVQDQNQRGSGLGQHIKNWDPLRISATVEDSNFKFGTQIWFWTNLLKKMFRTEIGGCLGEGCIQKVGTPYLFLEPLKLVTEKVVRTTQHECSGLPCQTQALGTI